MKHLDRALQRRILDRLAESYPSLVDCSDLGFERFDKPWLVNASFLAEHGLIKVVETSFLSEGKAIMGATITARGLDFLEDDGGLGAVLNVVTVRLEADTLRQLIAARVDASNATEEEKSRIRKWLESAGSEALSQATQRLVESALDSAPAALRLLATLAG